MSKDGFLVDVRLLSDMTGDPTDTGIVITNNSDEYELDFENIEILDEFIDLLIKRRNQAWPHPKYNEK